MIKRFSKKDIAELRKNFSKTHFSLFSIHYARGPLMLGVVVSKKVDKKAVVRNKVRRRVRCGFEAVLKELQQETTLPSFEELLPFRILFISKKEILTLSWESLCEEIKKVILFLQKRSTQNSN